MTQKDQIELLKAKIEALEARMRLQESKPYGYWSYPYPYWYQTQPTIPQWTYTSSATKSVGNSYITVCDTSSVCASPVTYTVSS
jgi:hypothetical protein